MITSFRRLVLAVLIASGLVFSGTIVIPQPAAAQDQVTPKKDTKKTKKKAKKSKKTKKSTKAKKSTKTNESAQTNRYENKAYNTQPDVQRKDLSYQ